MHHARDWHFVVWPRKDGELTAFFRWLNHTHTMPLTVREPKRVQASLSRCRPLGTERWLASTANRLGLEHTTRPEGRPTKSPKGSEEQ